MKKTILARPEKEFRDSLRKWEIFTVALGLLTLVLTIIFISLRNDDNHTVMYILTVITDVLYAWYLIAVLGIVILPRHRLLSLYKGIISHQNGKIVNISEQTVRVRSIDCYKITLENEEKRVLFAPDTLALSVGDEVTAAVMSNFILEAVYE